MDNGQYRPTTAAGGKGMNPLIRRTVILLMLTFVIALHLAAPGVSAALMPAANYLGRISGVIAPVRLASDSFGKLYVADPRNGGVLQFNSAGTFIKKLSVKGARGVAITASGDLVVTHGNAASVISTDTGSTLLTLTPSEPFKQANGVAVDDAGSIYVVDTLNSVIKVFLSNGQFSKSFAVSPLSGGQLSRPTAIAFDVVSKQLVVADTGNARLVFFDKDGGFIRSVGGRVQNGTAPLFTSPQSVSLEYTKTSPQKLQRIYVSDSFQSEVQIVDPQGAGTTLGSIGGYGTDPGKLKVPVDTLFDPASSRLFIANGTGEITIYGINVTSNPVPDTTPPSLTIDAPPAVTYTSAVVLSGSVEKEALLQITAPQGVIVGAVSYYPAPDASLSYWQAALSELTTGVNKITVTARDSATNVATKEAAISYDPAAIKVTIAAFTAPVKTALQVLSGTADQGSTVTLKGPAGVTFTPVTITASTWNSSVSGLAEGVNAITVTAAIGANSSSATTRITLLTSKPGLEVSTLTDGSKTAQPVLNVSGRLPDDSYFGSLTVNGESLTPINNAFSTTVTLKPGVNTVTIVALDTAGNKSESTRSIILDEALPAVSLTEPSDGSYINGTETALKGKVQPGNTVQLLLFNGSSNGVPLTIVPDVNGSWSTVGPVPLDPGLNTVIITVTDSSGKSSSTKTTITRDATVPALAVTDPIRDVSLNKPSRIVTGTVASGSDISATLNGVVVPVTVGTNGAYSIPVALAEEKQYALAITATDALGKSVTTYRNLVFDITAPKTTVVDAAKPLIVTFSDGTPEVLDKNGPVAGVTTTVNPDGSRKVDVSNATFDSRSLDIHAVDAAGNSTRNGDVNGDGTIDIKDAMKVLRLSLGLEASTAEHKLRGDVAPVLNGASRPDGVLDVFDVIYLIEKIVGLR